MASPLVAKPLGGQWCSTQQRLVAGKLAEIEIF